MAQEIIMSPLFGEGMVLQRDKQIPVFGKVMPNTKVSVTFRNQKESTVSGSDGKWMLKLKPEVYGGPDKMIVQVKDEELVIKRVYVGEVWICSGQSNMEMPMISNWAHVNNAEQEVREAVYPNIHLFKVERKASFQPVDEIKSHGWKVCSPESVADFSAVAYFFGRELECALEMPVGLIQSAWGGTVAEAWTSSDGLREINDFKEQLLAIERVGQGKMDLEKKYIEDLKAFYIESAKLDVGIQGKDTVFNSPDLNDSAWLSLDLPGMVESTQIGPVDGAIWFRKTIHLSKEDIRDSMFLHIAAPDDEDETWFNGYKVGESKVWDVPRKYSLPDNIIKEGKNVITIRLIDNRGAGGFMGEASHFALTGANGFRMGLAQNWKCKLGYDLQLVKTIPMKPNEPNQPSVLFNGMIHPLVPYAFRGVIWYQGESNVGRAKQYKKLFPALITDWRKQWGSEDIDFLFVQLASYLKRNIRPVEDSWSELREAQRETLKLAKTGMAVAIDLGDANDIHPGNKQDVGKRLAFWALNKTYNKNVPCCGPTFKSVRRNKSELLVEFENCYRELTTSDKKEVKGFAIAGKDGIYHWANAEIKGNTIILNANMVSKPVAVRYAWSSNPECNLINSANLPASPFEAKL